MLAQRLDTADLEPRALECADDVRQRVQLAVGKHVARDERIGRGRMRDQAGDPVVQEQPAGPEQSGYRLRIVRELGAADVLVHADAGDLVERPVEDLAVILDTNLDAFG